MGVRVAAGLFRLWIVLGVLWLAVAATYLVISYRSVELPDSQNNHRMFDDLILAYEHCWENSNGSKKEDRSTDRSHSAICGNASTLIQPSRQRLNLSLLVQKTSS